MTIFRADAPRLMRRITQARAKQDAESLGQAAHALKGALMAIGATPAHQAAAKLEAAARTGDDSNADALITALKTEMSRLERKLKVKRKKRKGP